MEQKVALANLEAVSEPWDIRPLNILQVMDLALSGCRSIHKVLAEKVRQYSLTIKSSWSYQGCFINSCLPVEKSASTFFNTLSHVLPYKGGYQDIYKEYLQANPILDYLESREDIKKWIYNLEITVNNKFKVKCDEFSKIEDDIENYRAGCDSIKSDTKPTCRRILKK